MYSVVETITPEIANDYLNKNISNNRKISTRKVNIYAEDIKNNRWQLNSQGITFNKSGMLTDGQHRLMAIVKANTPVQMYVTYGEDDSVTIHDRGRQRTTSDILQMSSKKEIANPAIVGIANFLFRMYGKESKTSDSIVISFIEENSEKIMEAYHLCATANQILRKAPCMAAIFLAIFCGEDKEKIIKFCQIANTGFQEKANQSSAIVLRNFLISNRSLSTLVELRGKAFAVTLLAIHDFANEVPRKKAYNVEQKLPYFEESRDKLIGKYFKS